MRPPGQAQLTLVPARFARRSAISASRRGACPLADSSRPEWRPRSSGAAAESLCASGRAVARRDSRAVRRTETPWAAARSRDPSRPAAAGHPRALTASDRETAPARAPRQRVDHAGHGIRGRPAPPHRKTQIVLDRHVWVERIALEHHRDVALAGLQLVHHLTADQDLAVRDVLQPAIMRSKVDFPQPDGLTRTTNSPSCTERSTPQTTSVRPNRLRTSRSSTSAMPGLAAHLTAPMVRPRTTKRCPKNIRISAGIVDSIDAVANLPVFGLIFLGEAGDRHRYRRRLAGSQVERHGELVPRKHEGEHAGGDQPGTDQGQRDPLERINAPAAVDQGGVFDLLRGLIEIRHHQPDGHRQI